ncbi:MAG: HEAT repeat domain-containing protein [Elusimicrobia bacterium]|nr:HEAT repeat domain-containing protein [Elusimicrobiota bacterium]
MLKLFLSLFVAAALSVTVVLSCPRGLVAQETPVQTPPQETQQVDPFTQNINHLKDKDVNVRRQAVEALLTSRDNRAVPHLIVALKDTDAFVRSGSANALGLLRAKESVQELSRLVTEDTVPEVRQSAAVALSYIYDKSVVPALLKGLSDSNEGPKYACMQTLGILKSTEAVAPLIAFLSDTNKNTRLNAINALGTIGDRSASASIREGLKDPDLNIKMETIRVLAVLNDTEGIPSLKELLDDPDKQIKIRSANALSKLGDQSGLNLAIKLASDKDSSTRIIAIDTLGNIPTQQVLAVLKKAVTDTDRNVQQTARFALQKVEFKLRSQKKAAPAKPPVKQAPAKTTTPKTTTP